MVQHAEASRLNIERMKQIYQQLSCYRGLGKIIIMIYNVACPLTPTVKCILVLSSDYCVYRYCIY